MTKINLKKINLNVLSQLTFAKNLPKLISVLGNRYISSSRFCFNSNNNILKDQQITTEIISNTPNPKTLNKSNIRIEKDLLPNTKNLEIKKVDININTINIKKEIEDRGKILKLLIEDLESVNKNLKLVENSNSDISDLEKSIRLRKKHTSLTKKINLEKTRIKKLNDNLTKVNSKNISKNILENKSSEKLETK